MSARDGNPEIYVINVDGSNLRRLTNHPAGDGTPTWSPNSAQIAFVSDRTGTPQIYLMAADGSNVRRITMNESWADRPTWSPPGVQRDRVLAGERVRRSTSRSTTSHRVRRRRSPLVRARTRGPRYSANGRHLAFTSTRSWRHAGVHDRPRWPEPEADHPHREQPDARVVELRVRQNFVRRAHE